MIIHGKFISLTLVNWNGFFARTFDLDHLVTTLSGGNGAGKSTTMAAFVTALIPDLTLLHFRNTTEAGATTGSRDKGLHGKLRPGVCYALLEIRNSRDEQFVCGVRLQQIAGRDKKVDIKPFILQNTAGTAPIDLVTDRLNDRQVRILNLNELKERYDNQPIDLKQFNAITDYHSMMFDLGVLPKRLRSSSERGKYYRLIEASLYGGISSTITRSLRDYLLPENSGVRKAFQDMELAMRENRMTLEAIKMTQADRDMFKHLITESTHYVAADYMRHQNERRSQIEGALDLRRHYFADKQALLTQQYRHVEALQQLDEANIALPELESKVSQMTQRLNQVQMAQRQYEKIETYQYDVDELEERLMEQREIVEEKSEQTEGLQQQMESVEAEIDALTIQLSDYQQALDAQQTQAIQYEQAVHALEQAREWLAEPNLSVADASIRYQQITTQLEQAREEMLSLEQRFAMATAAADQCDRAYDLLQQIVGETPRETAWQVGKSFLNEWPSKRYKAEQLPMLTQQKNELNRRQHERQNVMQDLAQLQTLRNESVDLETLNETLATVDEAISWHQEQVVQAQEERIVAEQQMRQLKDEIEQLQQKAPIWLKAQSALEQLQSQVEIELTRSSSVTEEMQRQLVKEREQLTLRDQIATEREQVQREITELNQPNGTDDPRLTQIAEQLGGVLLAEIYDDLAIEDAAYFSALYGPARQAIVVPDLNAIKETVLQLTECPEDLYLIEGDPNAFDATMFENEEFDQVVLVHASERQWRRSTLPTTPRFGRAARERQLEQRQLEREQLNDRYAIVSFELQKIERRLALFGEFVAQHIAIAFDPNPEHLIQDLQSKRHHNQRILSQYQGTEQQLTGQFDHLKQQKALLERLLSQRSLLQDETLDERLHHVTEQLLDAEQADRDVKRYQKAVTALEPILEALHHGSDEQEALQETFTAAQETLSQLSKQQFVLKEVLQRQAHFEYADRISGVDNQAEQRDRLLGHLERLTAQKNDLRNQLRDAQKQYQEANQLWVSLQSALSTKKEMLVELHQELAQYGQTIDTTTLQQVQSEHDRLQQTLLELRQQISNYDRQVIQCENEMKQLQKSVTQERQQYELLRQQILQSNTTLRELLHLVKSHQMEKQLHRRELAYLSSEALRSMSDKALGSLRLAVMDNEHLRDVLRLSEDPKRPERKVAFYIAVYQHLRERIRQDILKTDDPIDAIEQMEIELNRLTDELSAREQQLTISSKSVANIIRKTIQREQYRITLLNQGLQAVAFGQVNGVRLNVTIRESHTTLLAALAEQNEAHDDLFHQSQMSFSEALAKLYQRLNPQVDLGQRTAQNFGESLLDYRNYLDLDIEVNRGTEGWLRAESGALSTGEAIGTGMSILLMVIQSWEDESKRLRSKEIEPCRLLFLDEAARLDGKSIATLFELCEKLQMQLIIAAPENISPEKGTTYKLMRKVVNDQEYVHVIGLKGFA